MLHLTASSLRLLKEPLFEIFQLLIKDQSSSIFYQTSGALVADDDLVYALEGFGASGWSYLGTKR